MTDHTQGFHNAITAVIAYFRDTRTGNLRQRKLTGLITDWHRSRLLTLQASYMMITRAATNLQNLPEDAQPVRHDETFLDVVKAWTDGLTDQTLFDTYQANPDTRLLVCLVGLYVEYSDMAKEIARRLQPKRFTLEMVRAGWGELEDHTAELTKLFESYKTKQFAAGLRERALKDPANEPEDFDQSNWERAMELFEERSRGHTDPPKPLAWFDSLPLRPHEQAFFDGPIATAWRDSLPKVLADHDALRGTEDIPRRLRYAQEAAVEKIERRRG